MGTAIRIEGLTKTYGSGVLALDHLDLEVESGEIFGFLGPNGAGKTTTIRLLLDLIRPNRGRAEILGRDCQRESVEVRSLTGYLPGDVRLYDRLTGRQTVEFFASLRSGPVDEDRVSGLAERLQLDLTQRADALSKGNRQKLGLLVALLDQPPVLLLDEPTSGLDPLLQHTVWQILREEAAEGSTVFFSSHVMSEVEEICERVGILRRGRLVEVAPVSALKGRSLRRVTALFGESPPGPEAFRLRGVTEVERRDGVVAFSVEGDIGELVRALAEHGVTDLESRAPTLDEIMRAFYEEEPPA